MNDKGLISTLRPLRHTIKVKAVNVFTLCILSMGRVLADEPPNQLEQYPITALEEIQGYTNYHK